MIIIGCFLLVVSALAGGIFLGMRKFFVPMVCFMFFVGGISTMQEAHGWFPASTMATIGLIVFTVSFLLSAEETLEEEQCKCK